MTQISNDTQYIGLRTAWYPVEIKPVRPGWYEIKYDEEQGEDAVRTYFFDGAEWTMPLIDGQRIRCAYGNFESIVQEVWRGLSREL